MQSLDQTWEKIHSTQEWGQYPGEPVIRFVARNFYKANPRSEVKILDFGCGGGANTWYLVREGFDVYAFDGSVSAVENTKKKLARELGVCTVDLRVRDACQLDYEDDFFDGVIDSVCICQNKIENIQKMYQEISRILKPGGKMFTSGFGKQTTGYGTGKKIEDATYTEITEGRLVGIGTTHFTDEVEMKMLLEKARLHVTASDYIKYTDREELVHNVITIAEK